MNLVSSSHPTLKPVCEISYFTAQYIQWTSCTSHKYLSHETSWCMLLNQCEFVTFLWMKWICSPW